MEMLIIFISMCIMYLCVGLYACYLMRESNIKDSPFIRSTQLERKRENGKNETRHTHNSKINIKYDFKNSEKALSHNRD